MNIGDKYCNNCFNEREKSASKVAHEISQHFLKKIAPFPFSFPFPFLFVPLIPLGIGLNYMLPDRYIYHVYINGNHEKWTKNVTNNYNLQKCKKCSEFSSIFYQLEESLN